MDILNRIVGANVKALIKRAKKIKIADTSLKVVAIADLIMLKKLAGRKQDLADIEKLKAVKQLKR